MAKSTTIEWTDATFNPWWGCERVSPACAHCYADTLARRYGHTLWKRDSPRRFLSDQHWRQPHKWNRDAQARGKRLKVFCASMADVFEDRRDLDGWRGKLWTTIEETPWLDWQLLTKRPELVLRMAPWRGEWPSHVWIGASIENSRFTYRADLLRAIPAQVRFISAEPLLGSLFAPLRQNRKPLNLAGIHWVIAGGESGARHRPLNIEWVRELRQACRHENVAFFFKQHGGRTAKAGGRLLDGRTWDAFPDSTVAP